MDFARIPQIHLKNFLGALRAPKMEMHQNNGNESKNGNGIMHMESPYFHFLAIRKMEMNQKWKWINWTPGCLYFHFHFILKLPVLRATTDLCHSVAGLLHILADLLHAGVKWESGGGQAGG